MNDKSSSAIARYAVYFAPSDQSQLGAFGLHVLQRGACENDHPLRQKVTEKAAHYGFHSTFKAPMELAKGCTEQGLLDAVDAYSKTKQRVRLTGLQPEIVNGFHALTLPESPEVDDFAADVMRTFEPFRAPLTEADRQRRHPDKLSARQRQYLESYGYPHVLEEFHFHMTLSKHIDSAEDSNSYHQWLKQWFEKTVTETPWLDLLAVFWQPNRATAFTRIAEFPVN